MIPGFWGFIKGGILQGYPFASSVYYVGSGAPIFAKRVDTIDKALDVMRDRDVLFLGPGSHDEAVTVPVGLDNITIIGAGNKGDVSIAPSAANGIAMVIEGTTTRTQGITLINVGMEGKGTGGGLHVKGNIRRIRVQGCKCEGGAFGIKLESNASGAIGDTIIEDCELAWATTALHLLASGGGDPVTQTYLRNCLLHGFTADGVLTSGTFAADLWIVKNIFARQENGTEPTQYLDIDDAGTTGFVAENSFATPTNATGKLAIASGVIWGPNGTEAGWSTQRPL